MGRFGKSKGNRESKYFRLTGLWQSKKNDKLFTGKLRGQDVEKLIAKLEEADGNDIAFFLWENDQESRKDPVFTLQCTVSDGDGFKKSRHRDDDEEEDRPRRKSHRDEEEEEEDTESEEESDEEEDEKPARKSKGSSKTSTKGRKSKAKKDEDW